MELQLLPEPSRWHPRWQHLKEGNLFTHCYLYSFLNPKEKKNPILTENAGDAADGVLCSVDGCQRLHSLVRHRELSRKIKYSGLKLVLVFSLKVAVSSLGLSAASQIITIN